MAKYDIKFSCGHEGTVELLGKNTERERKIKYFEEQGLCSECYRKQKEEEEKQKGFVFNVSILPYISEEDGAIMASVWFDGDTKPHKDDIKGLGGYRWEQRESSGDMLSMNYIPNVWQKNIKLDDLVDEAVKAKSIGAERLDTGKDIYTAMAYQIALQKQKEWKERKAAVGAIEKPAVPEILKGKKWNQKIYGKKGRYSIYPDGEKVEITDGQAEEIEKYLEEKEEYKKKVEEIKNKR